MNQAAAIDVLEAELNTLRRESYEDLVRRIGTGPIVCERTGTDAVIYQIEIDVLWDGSPGGNVLVMGSIDDGGWRAFVPITRSFIKSATGGFVGE